MSEGSHMEVCGTDLVMVPVDQVKEQFGNTRSIFDFLTIDMELFLPSFAFVNMVWLSAIWANEAKVSRLKFNLTDIARPSKKGRTTSSPRRVCSWQHAETSLASSRIHT